MQEELKRCPFCGGIARMATQDGMPVHHFVNCVNCLASSNSLIPHGDSKEDAVSTWNRRTPAVAVGDDTLSKFIEVLGWQGGTVHDVVSAVKALRRFHDDAGGYPGLASRPPVPSVVCSRCGDPIKVGVCENCAPDVPSVVGVDKK